jgi:pSer/pThr/pTyr-binding forkhead associated (FHA) protein
MKATFRTTGGPHTGQQIQIFTGQVIRVGRTARSDYALPGDTYLSGAHFEIRCEDQECRVRDLGSSNGTFVNGAQITESVLQDGDEVAAGETTFLVQVTQMEEGDPAAVPPVPVTARPLGVPGPPQERTARMHAPGFTPKPKEPPAQLTSAQQRAHEILMDQTAPLYAVLDAARDAGLLQLVESSRLHSQPLFEKEPGNGPPAVHAPYLVELGQTRSSGERSEARAFLQTLLQLGWGNNSGVFLTSLSPLEELRPHFRQFLLAGTEDRRALELRFYDPRLLRAFLPVCEPEEVDVLFGPVLAYLMETEQANAMLVFSRGDEGLIADRLSLDKQSQAKAGV